NLGATITRVEAKLVLYKEWERASASGRSFATDPDMLVWVVVRAGRGLYCGMGGPLGASTRECHVSFSVLPARPPDQVGVFGTMPAWPAWFRTRLPGDRKSTRLNSSHVAISYAVFCLK